MEIQVDSEVETLTNKLSELSSLLDKEPVDEYFHLESIEKVIGEVHKAFSGSWIGYHSQVYYENFEMPPAGAIFSVQWGLGSRYGGSNRTIGSWLKYNNEEVIQYIYDQAKFKDFEKVKEISRNIKDNFEKIKSSLMSIISIGNLNTAEDSHYKEIIEEIRNNKCMVFDDFRSHYSPKQIVSSDYLAVMNGIKPPAHMSLLFEILVVKEPVRCWKELNKSVKLLIDHRLNKESLSVSVHKKTYSNKIFIVHGHDNPAKLEVARLIENLGLEAVILHEQIDSGNTVIEKLEKYTDVGFGVVLYTACDFGGSLKSPERQQNRARQNVVFEHGYLIGKLGRNRVCALIKNGVEYPSDVAGIVYKSMDENRAWRISLAQELKAAGFDIDLNNIN